MTQDRAEATRRRLLEATAELLRTHGTAGLTSRELARAAGVNLQAITYHFGSKDELVSQALTGIVQDRLSPVLAALDGDGDLDERLFSALRRISDTFAVAGPDLTAYANAVAAASSNPTLASALKDLHADLVGRIAALIGDLQREGYIQAWVGPQPMAELLIAIADGVAMHSHYGEPNLEGVLDQAAGLLLAAREPSKPLWPAAARAMLRHMRSR